MKKFLFASLAVTALVCVAQVVSAQPSFAPSGVPIDGGLSLIIGGGIAYAAKKGYIKRNKS